MIKLISAGSRWAEFDPELDDETRESILSEMLAERIELRIDTDPKFNLHKSQLNLWRSEFVILPEVRTGLAEWHYNNRKSVVQTDLQANIEAALAEVIFEGFIRRRYPDSFLVNVDTRRYYHDYRLNGVIPVKPIGTALPLRAKPYLVMPIKLVEENTNFRFVLIARVQSLHPVAVGWIKGSELLQNGQWNNAKFRKDSIAIANDELRDFPIS